MADRIGVMQAGRMAQVGTPAEFYEQPANRFVAEFLGGGNLCRHRSRRRHDHGLPGPGAAPAEARHRRVRGCWGCGRNACGWTAFGYEPDDRRCRADDLCRRRAGCPVRLADDRSRVNQSLADGAAARQEPGAAVRVVCRPTPASCFPDERSPAASRLASSGGSVCCWWPAGIVR